MIYQCGFKQQPWDWIDDNVLLGSMPYHPHIEKLSEMGIEYSINMTWIYDPGLLFSQYNIEQLRLPTLDHYEPTLQSINKAIDFISKAVEEGKKVYIFCKGKKKKSNFQQPLNFHKGGHGRSAAIAYCWLLKSTGKSLEETQKLINSKRHVRKSLYKQDNIKTFYYLLQSPKLEEDEILIDDKTNPNETPNKKLL